MRADVGMARGLGWFSIGLGAAEALAPGPLARFIGIENSAKNRALLRFYGVRELAAGIGLLSSGRQATWMWARVAGDAADLASLGAGLATNGTEKGRLAFATTAVLGVTALDVGTAIGLSRAAAKNHRVYRSIAINRAPEEVYEFWRDFSNLPRFMPHLASVEQLGERHSRWKAKALGLEAEWEAETVQDEPGLISWRTVEGSPIESTGIVRFDAAPGDRGTIVRLELSGPMPGQMVDSDLRALKQVLETGEVMKSDASIHSGPHAAQPPEKVPAEA